MTHPERELHRLAQDFAAGRAAFEAFHPAFIDRWTRLPVGALTPERRERWNEIYALVLRTVAGPVAASDAVQGVLGEEELRRELRRHPLLAGGV